MRHNSGVYEILNITNGKRYVGSSDDLKERKYIHWRSLRGNYHPNPYLQNAWNKYGEDAFIFKVLHTIYPVNLIAIEQGEIDTKSEYNIRKVASSNLGLKHTPKTKANMSAGLMGNQYAKGHKQTAEAKANASTGLREFYKDPKERAKISARMMGNQHNLGYKHTAEARSNMAAAQKDPKTRAKISAAQKGRTFTAEHKAKISAALKRYHSRRRAEEDARGT